MLIQQINLKLIMPLKLSGNSTSTDKTTAIRTSTTSTTQLSSISTIFKMIIQIVFLLFLLSNGTYSSSSNIKQLKRQVRQLSASKCVCGVENTHARLERITVGSEIKPELRFPWLLPLAYRNGSFFCAGTLINSRYVLTSAHCFRYSKQDALGELRYMISSDAIIVPERITNSILVGLGVHNLQNNDELANATYSEDEIQPNWLAIDYAIIHRFYENYENAILHDIALIRLRKELNFDRFKWLRPICLPDPDQFELEPFNKFQLQHYIQPNIVELNKGSNQPVAVSVSQPIGHGGGVNIASNDNGVNRLLPSQINNGFYGNPINTSQLFANDTNAFPNIFNSNDNLSSVLLLNNNEPLLRQERINSKRMNMDKLFDDQLNSIKESENGKKRLKRSDDVNDESLFFAAGWGLSDHSVWHLSKVPLWMRLKMLTRDQCIKKNGEGVKWNFICAEGTDKDQATTVGDSGGPFFGRVARKQPNNKLSFIRNRQTTPSPVAVHNKPSIAINNSSSATKLGSASPPFSQKTLITSTTTARSKIHLQLSTVTTSTATPEKFVIRYITKPPIPFRYIKRASQNRPAQQQTNNEMHTLLTKVKENVNRNFYSMMIYEDLFKGLNLPHDDLSRLEAKEEVRLDEEKEPRDLTDAEDFDGENEDKSADQNVKSSNVAHKQSNESMNNNIVVINSIDDELDLSRENYVQLGITSWSSYVNPEIGMYTDVRAYLGWIRRNTQDAHYCITDPAKLPDDDKIPMPTSKPDIPDSSFNLNCGAEKLNKISYPWIVSLYMDGNKFLGNCVYFYSNFVICSDIYAEQTSYDINQLSSRFSVEFYYPSRRFKVKNIVNRLLGSSPAISRREYLILQIDDPDNQLTHSDSSNRKFNRGIIDSQLNKNNPSASCISTKDYPINEESSSLVTFYLFAPGEHLIRTQLKLTAYRKCKQIAPNYVTRRFLCAEIGSSEEINISDHFTVRRLTPNRANDMLSAASSISSSSIAAPSNSTSFSTKLKNFFRIPTGLFQNYHSSLLKADANNDFSVRSADADDLMYLSKTEINDDNNQNVTFISSKQPRATPFDATNNFKEVLDGQPVFHKIDEQYTLIGFLVKAPFPTTLAFRHNNLILLLDIKKFRYQVVTKVIKSLRAFNSA